MEGGRSDRRERWRRAFVALCGSSDGEIKTDEVGQVSGFQATLALFAGRSGKKGGQGVSGRVVRIKSKALMYPTLHNSPHHPSSHPPIYLISHAAHGEKINQRGCKAGGEEESCVHGTEGLKVAKWHETRQRGGT